MVRDAMPREGKEGKEEVWHWGVSADKTVFEVRTRGGGFIRVVIHVPRDKGQKEERDAEEEEEEGILCYMHAS